MAGEAEQPAPPTEPQERLAGDEVEELTLFAEKQAWIASKISFLSALPPIEVVAPLPPARTTTTREQLEGWWTEHDRIEEEVGEFDLGDMARLRRLARDKSKQALSPKDTDLIEITLTTLFAVDKLLHLLRNRRKALALLGFRLQWEDAVASTTASHRQLVDDLLPSFLKQARWTMPLAVSSPSRHLSDDPVPTLSTSLSASTSSLAHSTSSRRLSSLASSTSTTTATSMSRTMRSQMVALSLSQLTSHLRTLTSSTLAASGTALDKLIDNSPSPLPEAFLDEQDRLELEAGRTTKGLRGWAEEMVRQWRAADDLFWRAHDLEVAAAALTRDIDSAIPHLPSLPTSSADPGPFPARLAVLSSSLAPLSSLLSALPAPTHPALSDLTLHHTRLRKMLQKNLDRASSAVREAEAAQARWDAARRVCDEAQRTREELKQAAERLRAFEAEAERLEKEEEGWRAPAPEDGPACLECRHPTGEAAWTGEWDAAVAAVAPLVSAGESGAEGDRLLRRAANGVVALQRAGVDLALRRALRDEAAGVRARREEVGAVVERERVRRERVGAARAVGEAVCDGRERVERTAERLRVEMERARWRAGPKAASEDGAPLDAGKLVEDTKASVSAAVDEPLRHAKSLLSPSAHTALLAHLDSLVSSVRVDADSLVTLSTRLEAVKSQAAAISAFDGEWNALEAALEGASLESYGVIDRAGDAASVEEWRATLAVSASQLREQVDALVDGVHLRVPFLASSPSPTTSPSPPSSPPPALAMQADSSSSDLLSSPFSLSEQDDLVRAHVNQQSAALKRLAEQLDSDVAALAHLRDALEWDARAMEVEERVEEVEGEARGLRGAIERREDDAEATLVPLLHQFHALNSTLSSLSLEELTTSLTTLHSPPQSSASPFHSNADRQTRLDALTTRLDTAHSSASTARETLLAARLQRNERVTAWEAARDILAREIGEVKVGLREMKEQAEKVAEQVEKATGRMRTEREELLRSEKLDANADVSLTEVNAGIETLHTLRNRLESSSSALSSLRARFDSLEAQLPGLYTPTATLHPASTALGLAQSALPPASDAVSRLSSLLDSAESDSRAFHAAREEELERRREDAELRVAAFEAWRASLDELLAGVDGDRGDAEQVAEEAQQAISELEERVAEVKAETAALLDSPELSSETQLSSSSRAEEPRVTLNRLQTRLCEVVQRAEVHAARAAMLAEEDEAKTLEGASLVEELQGQVSATPLAVQQADAALELLVEAVDELNRVEAEWPAARDHELERRKVEQEKRAEEEDAVPLPPPVNGMRRSSILPSLAIDGVDASDVDPFAASPDADPFPLTAAFNEPLEVQRLRELLASCTAPEWLDSTAVLQLPAGDDADELQQQVDGCRRAFAIVEALSPDALVWTDVEELQTDVEKREDAAQRVAALASFARQVDQADHALSNLLDSIDAALPDMSPPSPTPDSAPVLPLAHAISAASDSVTAVRLAAIPLVDDTRVARAIQRIEETWREMMDMVEPPRAGSSASTASTASLRSLKPRISDAWSSRASSRTSTRTPSRQTLSRIPSHADSLRSSTRPSSRPSSSAASSSSRTSRPPLASRSVANRPSSAALVTPRTPRKSAAADDDLATPTPRRRVQSGLPVPSSARRALSPLPKPTPTVVRAFSFNTPTKRDLAKSTSSIPRRHASTAPRDSAATSLSTLFSPPMSRISSTSTSSRRDSLASSRSSRAGDSGLSTSAASLRSPRFSHHSTPPKRTVPYLPNMKNKLDREVGNIVNGLNIHVPIEVAEGRWTDESGMYLIGGKLYFCRILRSKQVMVRVGGGWQNLLQFLITHWGLAHNLTISPSTSVKKSLSGAEPEWLNAQSVRDQLAASQSSSSLRDFLSASVSGSLSGASDPSKSTSSMSFSMRRSLSNSGNIAETPLRRSLANAAGLDFGPLSPSSSAIPKSRPPLPRWRP
ncbi:hypothetical protein JCM10207_004283 [Rhodosporidiobolus poonsookiae]